MSEFPLYEQLKRRKDWDLQQDFTKAWNEGFDSGYDLGVKQERGRQWLLQDLMAPCCNCSTPDHKSTSSDGIEAACCGCNCHKVERSVKVYE